MSANTGISWTNATWNPIRGCSRVSEGCRHCYAERVAARFSGPGQPYEGLAEMRKAFVQSGPGSDVMVPTPSRPRWTGEVRFVAEHLADPLRWRKPRRIFVNSMSDLFHERLTNEQIAAVFGVMAAAWWHTHQVLTKRAGRARKWFAWLDSVAGCAAAKLAYVLEAAAAVFGNHGIAIPRGTPPPDRQAVWPLANVWLGVSVENQDAADDRIPHLLATPAAVRFLSCEPLLGPVDLRCVQHHREFEVDALTGDHGVTRPLAGRGPSVDWVIAGCESGPGARPCSVDWLRSLRDQCAAVGVPFFCKQAAVDERGHGCEVSDVGRMTPLPVTTGPGSKRKPGGVIELPYLDGKQHAALPEVSR